MDLKLGIPQGILLFTLYLHVELISSQSIPSGCRTDMDILFILDSSESIVEHDPFNEPLYHWNKMQQLLTAVVSALPITVDATRVAIVSYSQTPQNHLTLTDSQTSATITQLLQNISPVKQGTNTAAALTFSKNLFFAGARPNARRVAVLFSDGLSNLDRSTVIQNAQDLKQWTEIHTVAMTPYIDVEELRHISSDYHNNFLQVDLNNLDYSAQTLTNRLCDVPDPAPPSPTPPNCELRADLAFLADNSGSIRDKNDPPNCADGDPTCDNYTILKQFLVTLARGLNVGPDFSRVAAIRFSNTADLVFDLDDYQTMQAVETAIFNMPFAGSYTNIAQAIQIARTQVFVAERGDRPDVRNVIILVTDGESTVNATFTESEADMAKAAGINFFVVGMTSDINEQELRIISSDPVSQHFFETADVRSLSLLQEELVRLVCSGGIGTSRKKRSVSSVGGRASRTFHNG